MGVAATFVMDLLASFSRRSGLTVGVDPRWIGRWFAGIPKGRLVHSDITMSPAHPREGRIALLMHYAIGIAFGIVFLACTAWLRVSPQNLATALAYGFATNVFPWFLMFPAMGFGVFGAKGPKNRKLFASSLLNHLFYGFGLWVAAVLVSLVVALI